MLTDQATAKAGTGTRTLTPAQQAMVRRVGLVGAALAILAVCVFFHVYRLGTTPGWDPQEGYNLDIAWNLLHGRLRLFALTSAFAQHPPLFYLQLALAIHIFGYGITAVRALAALYAILTCAALIVFGRRILGIGPALWAALAYTAAPVILTNTRWGYSYAQLAFVGLLCLWAAWRYEETHDRRWLLIAAALAGLAAFSDYAGIAWVVFVALLALRKGWRESALAAGIGLGILAVGLLACFAAAPGIFIADVTTTFGRAAGGNLIVQGVKLLLNYYRFVSLDAWLLLGIVGLFLVPASLRGFLLGALAALGLVILKVRDIGLSLHTIVPLLPLLALGMGVALDRALRLLYGWSLGWLGDLTGREMSDPTRMPRPLRFTAALVVFVAVVSPLGMALAADASGLAGTLATRQDTLLATPSDAQAAARYVFAHARSGDLALASPNIAWMFDQPEGTEPATQGADILQTLAQAGKGAAFYPSDLPASRWAYTVSLDSARFVVADDLVRQLAAPGEEPALIPLLHRIESWPAVFRSGQYTVYEQPAAA
jgi:4-amino-4-deoxy-L-arabinose transferase-like glycosyltransferase